MTCPTGSALRDSDDARHRLACPDPLVGASDQRGHGTRQDDLSLHAAWTHCGFVGRATKTEVLHAHESRPGLRRSSPRTRLLSKSSSTRNLTPCPTTTAEPGAVRGRRPEETSPRSGPSSRRLRRGGARRTRPPRYGDRARTR